MGWKNYIPFKGNNDNGKWQKKANEPVEPMEFYDPENKPVVEPFIVFDEHPNDEDFFAIMKTTENGKYVRGGLLHFLFNGLRINAPINDVIFVDRINKEIFIKNQETVIEEITPKEPETRQYIIMYTAYDEEGQEIHQWEAMEGRNNAYQWIVDNIDDLNIDPEESYILVETVPYKDALTMVAFVKYLQNAELVEPDGFDIDEYI